MSSTSARDRQFTAILGDLAHKQDLYLAAGDFGPRIERYWTAKEQSAYLRAYHPDLVPPKNPNGTDPSEHSVSTAFEFFYYTTPSLRVRYLRWIRHSFPSDFPGL